MQPCWISSEISAVQNCSTSDIEAMFMQVAIRSEDQDALRVLCNKDGELKIFKYKRLKFSATCSPSCAIYILHRCGEDNKFSKPEAYSAIRNSLYMDYYIQSFRATENAAIATIDVKDTLQKGVFKITNNFSNDPSTVMKITAENTSTVKEQLILGQMWNASSKDETGCQKHATTSIVVTRCIFVRSTLTHHAIFY